MFEEKKVEEVEPKPDFKKEEPKPEVRKEEPKPEVREEEPKPEVRKEEPKPEFKKEEEAEAKPVTRRGRKKKEEEVKTKTESKKEADTKEEPAIKRAKESKGQPKELQEVEEVPEILGSHDRANRVWTKMKTEKPKPGTRYVVVNRVPLYKVGVQPGAIYEVVAEARDESRQPKGMDQKDMVHFVRVRGVGLPAFSLRKLTNVFSPL